MQLSIFALLILSSFFLFNACNKDADIVNDEITYRNTAPSGFSATLSNINFDQDGNILLSTATSQITLQHASIENQREVSSYIFNNLSLSRIDSIREMNGIPLWEIALIDKNRNYEGNYIVSIPFVKN